MSQIMGKLRRWGRDDGEQGVTFRCPACERLHSIRTAGPGATWGFDGNFGAPTFTPSVLVTYSDPDGEWLTERCHSFVVAGRIQYLADCTHALAGQTVELPAIED